MGSINLDAFRLVICELWGNERARIQITRADEYGWQLEVKEPLTYKGDQQRQLTLTIGNLEDSARLLQVGWAVAVSLLAASLGITSEDLLEQRKQTRKLLDEANKMIVEAEGQPIPTQPPEIHRQGLQEE